MLESFLGYFSHISPIVFKTLLGLFSLLGLATCFVYFISRNSRLKNSNELRLRTKSWWYILGIFAITLVGPRTLSVLLFLLLSFLAFREYVSLIPTRKADRRVLFWAYLAIPLQYLWIAESWYGMFIIFIPVYVFLFLPFRMVVIGETSGFVAAAGTLHWGLMQTAFSLGHIAFLTMQPVSEKIPAGGPGLVLFLVVLTELNDVLQYVNGKLFGRNKIIPRVSPNKTVEGFLGGMICTAILSTLLAPVLTPFSYWQAAGIGLLIAGAGFVGDVVMSAVKRDVGVKDSGQLIPGHGGILDRIDSLTFTAPLFFHVVWYLFF